ncbi:hypothetical protein [Burkholderia anthina]|uniref:hypothetical protein n=1 Tax=Burkholderia anthina TaxID=179879 RepID=UPI00158ED082|nr:hypothetical protein [Burkholderia anthina]
MNSRGARKAGSAARILYEYPERGVSGMSSVRISSKPPSETASSVAFQARAYPERNEVRVRVVPSPVRPEPKIRVVDASERFQPANVSTVSITVAGDKTIDHRMSVLPDHAGEMMRALRALARKIEDAD